MSFYLFVIYKTFYKIKIFKNEPCKYVPPYDMDSATPDGQDITHVMSWIGYHHNSRLKYLVIISWLA